MVTARGGQDEFGSRLNVKVGAFEEVKSNNLLLNA